MSGPCCGTPVHDDGRGANPDSGAEWTVYIIRCDDGSLYTGVTTDLQRRLDEHRGSQRGARYFNGRRPVRIEYAEPGHSRSSACRREAAIRKLGRAGKLRLIAGGT